MTSQAASSKYKALKTDDTEAPPVDNSASDTDHGGDEVADSVGDPGEGKGQDVPDAQQPPASAVDVDETVADDDRTADADDKKMLQDDGDTGGDAEEPSGPCCARPEKTDCLIYSSQALSAWGDRMWSFAVALFLVELEDNSLRLTAVYGFALAISVLVFGALVGRWVDSTPRLKATRAALLSQNSFVIVCAIFLLFLLKYKEWLLREWAPALYILCMVVILLGVVANLCSLAQKICVQKDWVVVLAGDDREKLAQMNAMIRRIDLSVNILAPIIVGLIMNFASMTIAALYIAGWNVLSMIAEYFLLLKVYKAVPALARKASDGDAQTEETATPEQDAMMTSEQSTNKEASASENRQDNTSESKSCCSKFLNFFSATYEGWKTYRSYTVSWAGMGIAMFYMTVMGFDSITNGYGYSIGVPEYMIGVMRALGSLAGVLGTLVFPFMRSKFGLERTGLYACTFQVLCLVLCVASIWAPGSPFDPFYYQRSGPLPTLEPSPLNYYEVASQPQIDATDRTSTLQNGGDLLALTNSTIITDLITKIVTPAYTSSLVTTPLDLLSPTLTPGYTTPRSHGLAGKECVDYLNVQNNFWTAALFFGGQILQRMGLWIFDLVVTQSIQENIIEKERGVFNGVQRSIECSMDMLHFILVIILPCPATFGFLILLSWIFVIGGGMLFSVYSYKIRGHLIPKCIRKVTQAAGCCDAESYSAVNAPPAESV